MTTNLKARVLLVAAATAAGASRADVLIDNLGEPIQNPANVRDVFWSGQSFIMPGGGEWRLERLTLRLGLVHGGPAIVAELRADAGPAGPGALLSLLSVPALDGSGLQNEQLLPLTPVILAPETTYWVVMGVQGGGGYDWSYAVGNGASGFGSFGAYGYSDTQGAGWIVQGLEGPYLMRVDVSPVPEAPPAALLAAGLALLALRRFRSASSPS